MCEYVYPLCLKINTILGLDTQINGMCKLTKLVFVFYKKYLDSDLSFVEKF
jgi:hypothetical protein